MSIYFSKMITKQSAKNFLTLICVTTVTFLVYKNAVHKFFYVHFGSKNVGDEGHAKIRPQFNEL